MRTVAEPVSPTTAVAPPDPSALVLRQFRVVFNAVRSHFQQVEKAVGIGGAQVWALNAIRQSPGCGVTELARSMGIHQSTASNLVKQLIRRELVSAEKSATDRRGVRLQLAAAGLAVLQASPGPPEGVLPEALQKLPPQTLAQLHQSLAAVIQVLQADETAAGIPLADL